jgi:hypothetical protein
MLLKALHPMNLGLILGLILFIISLGMTAGETAIKLQYSL